MKRISQSFILITTLLGCSILLNDAYAQGNDGGRVYSKNHRVSTNNNYQQNAYAALYNTLVTIQMGLMAGNLTSVRTATVDTSNDFADFVPADPSPSHTNNQANLGLQFKFLFGDEKNIRLTATLNGEKILNPSNTVYKQAVNSASTSVTLHDNWVVRTLVGVESPVFYGRCTLGLSGGTALIGQSLNANISSMRFSTSKTAFVPSIAANMTGYVCSNCLCGHGLSITGQVIADQYPGIGVARKGNAANVNQKWQYTENLIFSVDLNKSR